MKKKIIISIIFLFVLHWVYAQDAQFTQFFNSKIISSPSFCGTTNGSRLILNFRDQWPVIPKQYITYSASLDHFFRRLKTGLGLYVLRDRAGDGLLTSTNVAMMYSYKVRVYENWHMQPGLKVGYMNRQLNKGNFVFGDQLSLYGNRPTSIESFIDNSVNYYDLGGSALFYNTRHWFAMGAEHLGMPNESMNSSEAIVPIKYYIMGGYRVFHEKERKLRPGQTVTILAHYKSQGKANQLDLGAMWKRNPLYSGFFYRGIPIYKNIPNNLNHDAISAIIGIAHHKWNVAYSYDFTVSRLISHTGGAHEVTLVYLFNQKSKLLERKPRKKLECPDF